MSEFLLQENSSYILQEIGDKIILEQSSSGTISIGINPNIRVSFATPIIPIATASQTQAQVKDQGITYNQQGYTYNQIGITYGGVYNQNQDMVPLFSIAKLEIPSIAIFNESQFFTLTSSKTDAQLYEQGITYNQPGYTYNQVNLAYGGVYQYNQDIVPIELSFVDIYSKLPPPPPPSGSAIPLAPGFFLFISQ